VRKSGASYPINPVQKILGKLLNILGIKPMSF